MKPIQTLQARWAAETPKIYVILGSVSATITALFGAILTSYTYLPPQLQQVMPMWLSLTITGIGLVGGTISKLQVKNTPQNNQ
jgi:hypothetical protein